MYYSRHPTEYQRSERSKQFIQDDRSTYYGGQSFKSINPIDKSMYRQPPHNYNTNMFYSQSQIPANLRPMNMQNQSSNVYMSRRLNEQPHSRMRVNESAYIPVQSQKLNNLPVYQSHYYDNPQPHYVAHQPQQEYRRQYISMRPVLAHDLRQAPQQYVNIRAQPLPQRVQQHDPSDFKIFCPACHQQYYNSQVQQHIQKHYLYNTQQFKLSNQFTEAQSSSTQPLTVASRSFYPLIEPQQFQTSELDQVNYLNKYKVQTSDVNKKQSDIKVRSAGTQFTKPPLQKRSDQTDVYNCFDNVFNNNGFSVNDLTKNNVILAKKRQLEDWEKVRSQKEGYIIRKN